MLVLVEFDVFGARTDQITKSRAQLAAFADIPADAHVSPIVFFNVEVALIVAVLAHRDTLETSQSAFAVDLTTKLFFSFGSRHFCGVAAQVISVEYAAAILRLWWGGEVGIVEGLKIRACMEVGMSEEVVRMEAIAYG